MKLIILCTLCCLSIALASVIRDEKEASLEIIKNAIERKDTCLAENSPCDPKKDGCCKDHKCTCGKKKGKGKKDDDDDDDEVPPIKFTCFCEFIFTKWGK
uniref:U47-Eretoxin-Ek1b_1 n=1 Tax=Eresus cinnaberinus TaxID=175337 RepID=A0A2D0PDD2_ERECI